MSHFLDRLTYFTHPREPFSGGHGVTTIEDRKWEDAYRNRWRHDKVVRSTHGVNCTGGCSWKIFVKNGLVSFEMQQTDYPRTRDDLPNHEPRGCQRGASFSWYLYSPHRIKHPMIRGRLLDLYRAERKIGKDPVEAWAAIQADPAKRLKYTSVRGLGGFVRTNWEEITEIVAADKIHTRARELAATLAANSPQALAATKALLNKSAPLSLDPACEANAAARQTPDCQEGVRAFLEKRKPNWI